MAVTFTRAKRDMAKAYLDGITVKIILCMDDNTLETAGQEDVTNVGGLTLDECDSSDYVRKTVASQVVNEDTGNNRAEFQFDPVEYTTLDTCTRPIAGYLLMKFVTNDAGSTPIAYVPFASPLVPNGGMVTITPNAQGALQQT